MKKGIRAFIIAVASSVVASFIYDALKKQSFFTTVKDISTWFYTKVLLFDFPLWGFLLLILISWVTYFIYKKYYLKKPSWLTYVQDTFKEWRWTWSYKFNNETRQWDIINLKPHCQVCGTQLTRKKDGSSAYCPKCDVTYPKAKFELEVDTKALIKRKIVDHETIDDIVKAL